MTCAVVGDGLAGLVAYATLRHGGLEPEQIAVFGTDPDPASAWRVRAAAIRQKRMRSESNGHVAATSFPGLAVRAAARRPWALVETLLDRYHPTVDEFLAHVDRVRRESGWDESVRPRRVERVQPVGGGFELDGEAFPHVLLAPGHPGLSLPEELAGRAVHAYESHDYANEVCVVGAGMAAATEWLNALAAGSTVISVRRHEPARRPLNVERHYFTKRGLDGFRRTEREDRVELLRGFLEPSYPPGRSWDEPLRTPRFRVEQHVNGAEQVICATGFRRGFGHDPLLARLVEETGVETAATWIVLDADSCVPALTDATRTLALAGAPAQWAFPAADTLVGMKVAARGFLRRVSRCPSR
jgi:cation diffusion facilitator CzcD-associated flavoprotein CzcO